MPDKLRPMHLWSHEKLENRIHELENEMREDEKYMLDPDKQKIAASKLPLLSKMYEERARRDPEKRQLEKEFKIEQRHTSDRKTGIGSKREIFPKLKGFPGSN